MVDQVERDGMEIYLADAGGDDAVVYLSGWRDFAVYHELVPSLLERFEEAGISCIAAPYRGLLGQPGEFTFTSMVDDALEFAEILDEELDPKTVTAVGNCVGGIAALGAGTESDLVERMVTMNTLFGLPGEDWWTSEGEYANRTRRWPMVEQGADGPLGTDFVGLDEEQYKQRVCPGPDRIDFQRRLDEFAHKPMKLMVSYRDEKIDPLHTWSMYRSIRNFQADTSPERPAEIEVVTRADPDHRLLLEDEDLQRRVADWVDGVSGA